MINDKMNAGGFAAVLVLSRLFTEATALPFENVRYGMQRFTVIILSFLLTAAAYLPLAAVLKRCGGTSPLAAVAEKSKLLSGFTGVIVSVMLLFCAAETGLRAGGYASETLFDSAPPVYFCVFTGAVLLFAVHKGTETSARAGTVVAAILGMLLLLIFIALFRDIETDRLYPALADNADTLMSEVMKEFSLNSEYLVFALLCGRTNGKRLSVIPLYLGISCGAMLFMTFLYNTVFGMLVSGLKLPFYTLSSISDIAVLHRINGIDTAVWIMAGILRTAFFTFAFRETVRTCFAGKRAAQIAAFVFAALSVGLSELFSAYPQVYIPIERIKSTGLPLAAVMIFIPAAAFLCTAGRKAARE